EILRGVLHAAVWNLVLQRVNQFDVADGAGQLAYGTSHAFVPFAADSYRPFHRGDFADIVLPIGTNLRKVIGKDVGLTAAIGAVCNRDALVRETHPWIRCRDRLVIPLGNLAQEDSNQGVGSKLHLAAHSGDVVGRHDRTEHGGNVQHFDLGFRDLLIGHGAVAGAEVHGSRLHLANAAAAADRLVID